MKNILFFFFFTALSLPAQTAWQTALAIPDTSLWSTELIELPGGDVLLLGRREFHNTEPGIPFEGYLTYGSFLARLDATGEVVWEQRDLPTGFLTAPNDLNVQGRQPAPSVLIDTAAGTYLLPYTTYAGLLPCIDPNYEAFSTRPGLLRGSLATGAVLSDTVYDAGEECGIEAIIRAYRHGDAVLAVTQHSGLGSQLLRFDAQGSLERFPYASTLLFVQDAAQDPLTGDLLVVGDDLQGQLAVLRTDTLGQTQQTYVISEVLFRLQAVPDGSGYLGWGPVPVGDSVFFALYRFDKDFDVQWTYLTPYAITGAAAADGGATFVLEGSDSGLDQTLVRVVRLDAQGMPTVTHDYPGEDLFPGSIVAGGDSCFVFTRTVFDLMEHPVPAYVEVTADCLSALTAAPEPPNLRLDLTILPNPAIDRALLRWAEPAPADAVLEVSSADGRVLQSRQVGGKTDHELNVTDWPQGVYVVALRGSGWKATGRLVRYR